MRRAIDAEMTCGQNAGMPTSTTRPAGRQRADGVVDGRVLAGDLECDVELVAADGRPSGSLEASFAPKATAAARRRASGSVARIAIDPESTQDLDRSAARSGRSRRRRRSFQARPCPGPARAARRPAVPATPPRSSPIDSGTGTSRSRGQLMKRAQAAIGRAVAGEAELATEMVQASAHRSHSRTGWPGQRPRSWPRRGAASR